MAHTQDHTPPRVIHDAPKRPVRARRPAALRQRVLNSDLQRRPPPGGVAGCGDCLELVAEDLKNHDWYRSGCLLPGSRRFMIRSRQPHPAGWLFTALFTAMAVNPHSP